MTPDDVRRARERFAAANAACLRDLFGENGPGIVTEEVWQEFTQAEQALAEIRRAWTDECMAAPDPYAVAAAPKENEA